MSKYGRHSPSSEIVHILNEIRKMSSEEIEDVYGIRIMDDKTVYDTAYDQTFTNVNEWAAFTVEQEQDDYEDEYYRRGQFDDEE